MRALEAEGRDVYGVEARQKGRVCWFHVAETATFTIVMPVKAMVVSYLRGETEERRRQCRLHCVQVRVVFADIECS